MIDKNELMKEEIKRYVELWQLLEECQQIINENYEREESFER